VEPITGRSSIILDDVVVRRPGPPETLLGVAEALMPGVTALAAFPPAALALALLCTHVLECLLKAYLSRHGSDAEVKKPDLRHNLSALWARAFADGLQVQETPPDWAECLSRLHNAPYHLRYSIGVHGIISPAAEPMASDLAALLETVREGLRVRQ
jgi:hypothetical protein